MDSAAPFEAEVAEKAAETCDRVESLTADYWENFEECQKVAKKHIDEALDHFRKPTEGTNLVLGIKPSLVIPYALAYLGVVGYAIAFLYRSGYYDVLIPGQPVLYPFGETLLSLAGFPLSTVIALSGFASLLYETRTYFPRSRRESVGDGFLALQRAQKCMACMQLQARRIESVLRSEDAARNKSADVRTEIQRSEIWVRGVIREGVSNMPLSWRWPMRLMLRLPSPASLIAVQMSAMVALLACAAAAGLITLASSFAAAVAIQLGSAALLLLGVAALDFGLRFTELMRRRSKTAFRVLVVMNVLFVGLFLTLSVPLLGRGQAQLDLAGQNLDKATVQRREGPPVTGFLVPVAGSADVYVLTRKDHEATTSERIPSGDVENIAVSSGGGVEAVQP